MENKQLQQFVLVAWFLTLFMFVYCGLLGNLSYAIITGVMYLSIQMDLFFISIKKELKKC